MEKAEIIRLVGVYSYPGIGIYYFFLDFFSPLTDEVSLVAIAYLSKTGLMNKTGAGVISFLALYGRNYTIFLIARKRVSWLEKLTKHHPEAMGRFQKRMKKNYFETILLLTFLPKVRIFAPVVAGFGEESKAQFAIYEAICIGLFVGIYYTLGLFFYHKMESFFNQMDVVQGSIRLIILLILIGLISYFIGRHFLRKTDKR